MAWGEPKGSKKKRKNRLGDVPGMLMLTIVLAYSVVMVVDGYLLCRSGLIKGPECDCSDVRPEIVYVTGSEGEALPGGDRMTTYFHNSMRFAFDYPEEWGEVTIKEELGTDPSGRSIIVGLMLGFDDLAKGSGGGIFMHANFTDANLAHRRLDYWGTDAVRISSLYDINSWCDGKENCTTFTNPHGMTFAKQRIDPGGVESKSSFDVYYMYNPSGGFTGVAFSPEKLDPKFGAASLQNGFEGLIDSVRPTEQ